MVNDPFYYAIVAKLSETLDPNTFEACAVAVVRQDFPTAVQVVGGDDAGMDGAIGDGEGKAYPLICTTGSDVIGNMTRNLTRYVDEGGKRRKHIVVTNRSLTRKKRTNLERRAEELGFTLVQIYDRSAVAQRLYRMPEWTKALLGLSGTASALSTIPPNLRGSKSYALIGRDDLITELGLTDGDIIVSGEPGSGKTAVLAELAEDGWGLFVTDDSRDKIADAIRSQQPQVIIIDDAQARTELVPMLASLRRELDADFRIAVVTWPSYRDAFQEELRVPNSHVALVDRLTRDQIAELIQMQSPQFPDWLIQEIVEQAEGLPGIATLLADTVISGDYADLRSGRKLLKQLKRNHAQSLSPGDHICIGAIALSGSRGITAQQAAESAGTSPETFLRLATELSYGGVVRDIQELSGGASRVAINPRRLRSASIGAAFFEPPQLVDLHDVADAIDDPIAVASELVDAALSGVTIDFDLLLEFVSRADSTSIWSRFSLLGERHARKAIDSLDSGAHVLAPGLFVHVPREALAILLERLARDNRSERQNPDHPARVIEAWILSVPPGDPEAVDRRKLVIESAERWIDDGGDKRVAFRAIRSALNPYSSQSGVTPGSGNMYWWRNTPLDEDHIEQIGRLWDRAFDLLQPQKDPESLLQLINAVEDRLHSRTTGNDEETLRLQTLIRDNTDRLVIELAVLSGDHQGLLAKLKDFNRWLRTDLSITLDGDYSALFVDLAEDIAGLDYQEAEDRLAREFEKRWSAENPERFFQRLQELESMSQLLEERPWPNRSRVLANGLASAVSNPCEWLEVGLSAQTNDAWLYSFLSACVGTGSTSDEAIRHYREHDRLAPVLVAEVLKLVAPPDDLLEWAVDWIEASVELLRLDLFISSNDISVRALEKLLSSGNPMVACWAALGEWRHTPHGEIRSELHDLWRSAIVECPESEHLLHQMLKEDPSLGKEWLESRIKRSELILVSGAGLVHDVLEALSTNDRVDLICTLPDTHWTKEFLSLLVGYDPAAFEALLDTSLPTDQRLAPLIDFSQDAWLNLLGIAQSRGFSSTEVATTVAFRARGWTGRASHYWSLQLEEVVKLREHLAGAGCSHFDIAVLEDVAKYYEAELEKATEQDRHEDVYGYDAV